ncbi:hypothetical protein C9374_002078 [Naegleria lovaniensis]|uniref:C2 DOCK-type domain-containing protein n=1 Tax=Naegleria lovaniensis TaxID=51637 RepID=A0AA88GWD3_NAELO|nr:uncharacterized protein C9374_002078 [Naegleria lovaniensis]KAG2387043.1 hypothetical protein C9374_002078 [Naegleria lovaniensis]
MSATPGALSTASSATSPSTSPSSSSAHMMMNAYDSPVLTPTTAASTTSTSAHLPTMVGGGIAGDSLHASYSSMDSATGFPNSPSMLFNAGNNSSLNTYEQQYQQYIQTIVSAGSDQKPSSKDKRHSTQVFSDLLFPDNLVQVIESQKTAGSSRPNTVGSISNVPHHIKEQFRYFESPNLSIDYELHGKFEKASLPDLNVRSKPPVYEADVRVKASASSNNASGSATPVTDQPTSNSGEGDQSSSSENNFTKLMKETESASMTNYKPGETKVKKVEKIVDSVDKTSKKIHANIAHVKNGSQKLNKTMFVYDMSTQSVEWDWNGGAEVQICKRVKDRKVPLKHSPILIELLDFVPKLFTEKFDSEKLEPFFITMCVVDFNTKKRISEEFHCDINHQLADESMRKLFSSSDFEQNKVNNRAIFQVADRSVDVFLYIRVYKIIQGDEDDAAEPYIRPEKCKDSKSKFVKNASENASKMRPFLQPMAYSFQQLFNASDEVCLENEVKHFLRTKGNMGDEQFFSTFASSKESSTDSLNASGTKGKMKNFPAVLKMRVVELNSDDYTDLKNEMDHVEGTTELDMSKYFEDEGKIRCKLMRELGTSKLSYFNEYDNTLYVYPQNVQIGSKGLIGSKSRSVSIKIELRNNDDNLDSPGLPLIYNRFNKTGRDSKTTHDFSTISYHSKHPEFNDEFKIQLPTHITDKHHLLFTFIHVPCKHKDQVAKEDAPYKANVGSVLGYSFVPLLDFTTASKRRKPGQLVDEDSNIPMTFNMGKLVNGIEQLPIYQEFSDKKGYTSEKVRSTSKLLENGKPLFVVSFLPFSTIYTTDRCLSHFFASLPLVISDNDVRDSVMFAKNDAIYDTNLVGGSGIVTSPSVVMKTMSSDDLFDGELPAMGTGSPVLRRSNSGAIVSSMNPESIVMRYISEMYHVPVKDLISFLPAILNQLLRTICTGCVTTTI